MHWPELDQFSMLLTENNRARAYLQNLAENGHVPARAVVIDTGNRPLPEHDKKLQKSGVVSDVAGIVFDAQKSVCQTLEEFNVPFETVSAINVNSEEVISALKKCPGEYVVYSGPGGVILREEILGMGKYFLHAHPGWLPVYRGSTTVYYALLAEEKPGVSVMVFNREVDKGPVFLRRQFEPPGQGVDLDYVYDPAIRTAALLDFFNSNRGRSPESLDFGDEEGGRLFFIIHPLLKHLALLSTR